MSSRPPPTANPASSLRHPRCARGSVRASASLRETNRPRLLFQIWRCVVRDPNFRVAGFSLLPLLLACALTASCASEPRPVAELARAHTLVEAAEQSGAPQYAAADLDAAREKLQRAERREVEPELAYRLAEEASADAQVAAARARAAKAEHAVAEVDASIESLRREANRERPQ
jgi:hypothetical protein